MAYDLNNLTQRDVEEMLLAVNGKIIGLDTDDNEYDSILPIWDKELRSVPQRDLTSTEAERSASGVNWYKKAFDYWESDQNCPITDGTGHFRWYYFVTKANGCPASPFRRCTWRIREANAHGHKRLERVPRQVIARTTWATTGSRGGLRCGDRQSDKEPAAAPVPGSGPR
jgi:hypothetical protein